MILSVILNPLLERRQVFEEIYLGEINRSRNEHFCAGGKGINICRQLNLLNTQNIALTFLGGSTGKLIRKTLSDEKIDFTFIPTKSESRSASIITEKKYKRITSYFSPNNQINENEVIEFKKKLEKMISNCSIVIFSGSSPSPFADEIFPFGIEAANRLDKISILDTYGRHLKTCIEKNPTVIHNNFQELENSLNINLSNEKSKLDFLKYLYQNKIHLSFLTDGSNPTYAAKFDFFYKIENPLINKIDETGSGDAFVAGIAYGLEQSYVFEDFVKIGTALGAFNAVNWDICNVNLNQAESLYDLIKISTIGKKMKIIDDSPSV